MKRVLKYIFICYCVPLVFAIISFGCTLGSTAFYDASLNHFAQSPLCGWFSSASFLTGFGSAGLFLMGTFMFAHAAGEQFPEDHHNFLARFFR